MAESSKEMGVCTSTNWPALSVTPSRPEMGGWVVMRVEDRRPEQPITLEEARPQIIRFLTLDEIRSLLTRLRTQTQVETLLSRNPETPGGPREPANAPPPGEAPTAAPEPPADAAANAAAPAANTTAPAPPAKAK